MSLLAAPAETSSPNAGLLLASDRLHPRLRRILTAYALGQTAWSAGKRARDFVVERSTFTVSLAEDDDVYPEVHRWVLDQLPDRARRALVAKSSRGGNGPTEIGAPIAPRRLAFFYDGSRRQTVTIEGHRVDVHVETPGGDFGAGSEGRRPSWLREKIIFTARSAAGRDAVIGFLDSIVAETTASPPALYVASRWSWNRRAEGATRALDTVVLRDGQLEAIVADLDDFLRREADYLRLGIPWHRGYLFSGAPGTGKTSAALALAAHFRLDAYFIPLSSIEDDAALMDRLRDVAPRSILLLEDVDVARAAKSRDDEAPGITLAGLLNALDGVATPHGVLTILTTNDASVLDPALVRPGRVDRREEFQNLDSEQLLRLATSFLGERPEFALLPNETWWEDLGGVLISPADVVAVAKEHLGSGRGARWTALRVLVEQRRRPERRR